MIRAFNAMALVGMVMALFWMSAVPAASAATSAVPAGMVATVNGIGISRADFLQVYHALRKQTSTRVGPAERRELKREALNNLIRRAVALDECRKQGIEANPGAVANEIAVMQNRFSDDAAFVRELRSNGLTLDRLQRKSPKIWPSGG
jgi:SurA-like N-terminal domain